MQREVPVENFAFPPLRNIENKADRIGVALVPVIGELPGGVRWGHRIRGIQMGLYRVIISQHCGIKDNIHMDRFVHDVDIGMADEMGFSHKNREIIIRYIL